MRTTTAIAMPHARWRDVCTRGATRGAARARAPTVATVKACHSRWRMGLGTTAAELLIPASTSRRYVYRGRHARDRDPRDRAWLRTGIADALRPCMTNISIEQLATVTGGAGLGNTLRAGAVAGMGLVTQETGPKLPDGQPRSPDHEPGWHHPARAVPAARASGWRRGDVRQAVETIARNQHPGEPHETIVTGWSTSRSTSSAATPSRVIDVPAGARSWSLFEPNLLPTCGQGPWPRLQPSLLDELSRLRRVG